jgi:hypothetical protein
MRRMLGMAVRSWSDLSNNFSVSLRLLALARAGKFSAAPNYLGCCPGDAASGNDSGSGSI